MGPNGGTGIAGWRDTGDDRASVPGAQEGEARGEARGSVPRCRGELLAGERGVRGVLRGGGARGFAAWRGTRPRNSSTSRSAASGCCCCCCCCWCFCLGDCRCSGERGDWRCCTLPLVGMGVVVGDGDVALGLLCAAEFARGIS
jgi:hypothetical protein